MSENLKFDFSNGSTNKYEVTDRHQLIPKCPVCYKGSDITFDGKDYFRYFVEGEGYVQTIFPYLDAEQRDLILTGIHPGECSKKFYANTEP